MEHERQVKLLFDPAEPRPDRERIVAAADGTTWDRDLSTGVFFDQVTRTAFPLPYCLKADWPTLDSGDYFKLKKAGYTGLTSSKWVDVPRRGVADWYLQSTGPTSEVATTSVSFDANTPFFLSFYTAGVASSSEQVLLECGWGVPGAAGSITLRFRSSGSVTVIKGTTPLNTYDWNGGTNTVQGAVRASLLPKENRTTNLLLLPCRWRSLLVLSDGGGFEHIFGDLPATGSQPTITPAGSFWWRVPAEAGAACVQCAPIEMEPEPVLYSRPITLRTVPPTATLFASRAFRDIVGVFAGVPPTFSVSLVDATTLATFVPNSSDAYVRIKITANSTLSNQYSGLAFYAADLVAAPVGTTTANAPKEVAKRCDIAFEVPESGPARLILNTTFPRQMEQEDEVPQVTVTTDRPVALQIGDIDIFRGTLEEPVNNWGQSGAWPLSTSWQGYDRDIEPGFAYYFDSRPFDNDLLIDAAVMCWQDLGFDNSHLIITADGFRLPYTNRVSLGEWLLGQEAGQTRAHWLERLRREWAATYITGWRPTAGGYKWTLLDPEGPELGPPVMALYEGRADAIAAGVPYELLGERRIRGKSERDGPIYRPVPPVVNHLAVVGYDPRRDVYPYAFAIDAASQAPGTMPADRPRKWRGRRHAAVKTERAVQTQAAAERVRDLIVPRAMFPRERVWFRSGLIILEPSGVPLWRGDRVTIKSEGGATRGIFRIMSLSARLLFNKEGQRPLWEADYMAERIIVPEP